MDVEIWQKHIPLSINTINKNIEIFDKCNKKVNIGC